ncbi:hypothetical protein AAC387_Pa10g0474 [Persea americana]
MSKKLLKDSMRLSRINHKLYYELKITESQNSSLASELDDVHAKVSQLESQRAILSEILIDVGKKNELLTVQCEKATKELGALCTELKNFKMEKENLNGKLKMVLNELDSANSSIKRINNGSMKLDEILMSQKSDSSKIGVGYGREASTSKPSSNFVFV